MVELLSGGSPTLVTITGRGGVGKTSLAREVVRSIDESGCGVWVPLAAVTDPELVLQEIANALEIAPQPGVPVSEAVAGVLALGAPLLVLDNAEHLLAAAPALAELLERCPALRLLVTSQAPLQLQGEQVVSLARLPDPPDPADITLSDLAAEPAVATYCQRAAAVDRNFELTDRNADAVVELCRRLEGLPLAIELAAARAATLPAPQILRLLESSGLDVLQRRRGDVPRRHQGLRSAIDWTYDLLSDGEQRALRRLSVMVGTFDLETAMALLVGAHDDGATATALDELSVLVDFHLVDPVAGADPVRCSIPESIRAVAHDELERLGETDEAQRRRISVRAAQAGTAAAGCESSSGEGRVAGIEADRGDLLDALRTAIDLGFADEALDLGRGLGAHWDVRGYGRVQEELLDRALELGERCSADLARRAHATLWSGYLGLRHASALGQDVLVERVRAGEALAASAGDVVRFHAQCVWLLVSPTTGDFVQAKAAAEEGLRLAEANDEGGWRATIQIWSGMLAGLEGDEERAVELGMAALEGARATGDRETVVRAAMLLGPLTERFPGRIQGLPTTTETIDLARELGLHFYEALLLIRGVHEGLRCGTADDVFGRMAESLQISRTMQGSPVVGFSLVAMVLVADLGGDHDLVARLHGALQESLPMLEPYQYDTQIARHQQAIDLARSELGDAVFERQVAAGAQLGWTAAVDEAARWLDARLDRSAEEPAAVPAASATGAHGVDSLTARQVEVLRLLAAGLSNKEIATTLGVTPKTVMHHTVAVYRTLGVRGRSEAIATAFRSGIAG